MRSGADAFRADAIAEPGTHLFPPQLENGGAVKAIVQHGYGAPDRVLRLEDVDRPPVGDDDVLIRVRATSVNTPDWIVVAGVPYILRLKSGLRRPRTRVRGTDVAGVVEAVGTNVTDLQAGDEVFGSSWAGDLATPGTFAEFTVAPASQLIKKPVGLTFEEAAASVMSGLTALIAIRGVGSVGGGTRVLINGASGGVGTFAVQIAKALGAEVTGVCSTRNLDLVRSLGADHVIDYTEEDFTRGERRYDVILDNVMNHRASATARVLTSTGTFIPNSVGNTGGLFAGLLRMARAAMIGLGSTNVLPWSGEARSIVAAERSGVVSVELVLSTLGGGGAAVQAGWFGRGEPRSGTVGALRVGGLPLAWRSCLTTCG